MQSIQSNCLEIPPEASIGSDRKGLPITLHSRLIGPGREGIWCAEKRRRPLMEAIDHGWQLLGNKAASSYKQGLNFLYRATQSGTGAAQKKVSVQMSYDNVTKFARRQISAMHSDYLGTY